MSLNIADSSKVSSNYARTEHDVATSPVSQEDGSDSTRRCRPRLLPTLAAALLLPLFIFAGNWQWNKATVKGNLQRQLDMRATEPAVQIPATRVDDPQSLRYRKVVAQGYYEPQHQVLIANRTLHERAGYHVITPLRLGGSEIRVLINRGWIPALAKYRDEPQVSTSAGMVEVSGTAIIPGTYFFTLGDDGYSTSEWHSVWQNLDLKRYGKAVGFQIQPFVVELNPESAAGGFAREWRRPDERLESHLSYAFQWWGMAATTVVLWLVLNFRRES